MFFLLLRRHTVHPPLLSSYLDNITMVKVHISNNIIKPFSVAKLQQVDEVASLLPLYLEGDALTLYMEMEEDDQKGIEKIEA